MSLFITNECISCDACLSACPHEAIKKGAKTNEINTDFCTECVGSAKEPQCKAMCPLKCIVKHPKLRETKEELKSKHTRLQLMKR